MTTQEYIDQINKKRMEEIDKRIQKRLKKKEKSMTYQQFKDKWNGKFCDYDKAFGFQCVDLMRQYMKEVMGLEPYKVLPGATYAKQLFWNYKTGPLSKISNGPSNFPKKGAIVFWTTYPFVTGIAGHVGIVDSADANTLIVFSQNYPSGSACSLRKFSYKGVIGWLE